MADNNIKIKLTADGKQARSEIKLIDQDLKKLNQSRATDDKKDNGGTTSASTPHVNDNLDKKATEQQKKSNDINTSILREMTLLRKELVKLNMNNSHTQSQSTFSNKNTDNKSANNASASDNGPKQPTSRTKPTQDKPTQPSQPTQQNQPALNSFMQKLGKIGLAIGSIGFLRSAYNSAKGMGETALSGQSLAYKTYGTSLLYKDYADARNDTAKMGVPYGYSMQESMNVVDTIRSNAGLTSKENTQADVEAILQNSKAFSLDTSTLANSISNTEKLGGVKSGQYNKLADMISEGIVQSGMIDRADEQLRASDHLTESLARGASSISEQGLISAMNAQVALSKENAGLKGQRGADILSNMASGASNDQDLLLMLGYGSKGYSGLVGKHKLQREIEADPLGAYAKAIDNYFKNFSKVDFSKMSDDEIRDFIENDSRASGMIESYANKYTNGSITKATHLLTSQIIQNKNKSVDVTDTEAGKKARQDRLDNYNQDDVLSKGEQYKVEKDRIKDKLGDKVNTVATPFKSAFMDLSEGMKQVLIGSGALLGGLGGGFGLASSLMGGNNVFNTLKSIFGKGSKASTVAETAGKGASTAGKTAETVGETIKNATSSVDGIAKGTSKGAETVAETVGKGAEVASKSSKLVEGASKLAKKAGAVGLAIDGVATGINVHEAIKNDDNREASQETGGFVGRLAGMWLGAKLGAMGGGSAGAVGGPYGALAGGALGGLAGGIAGLFLGDKVGQFLGETGYDVFGNGEQLTDEQKQEVSKYYNKVNEIYRTQGSSEARDYVNKEVVPYLSKIGVSKSYTDAYDFDWGENDFLEDVKEGVYGADVLPKEYMYVNEDGSRKSGDDLWKAYFNHNEVPETAVQEQAHTVKDIENPIVEAIENTATPTANTANTANTAVEYVSIPKDTTSTTSSSDTATDNNTDAINRNTVAINNLLLKNASVPNGALDDVFLSNLLKGHTSKEQLQALIEKDPTSVTAPKLNVDLPKDILPFVTPQNNFEEPLSTAPLKVDNSTDSNTEDVLSNTTAIDNLSNTVKTLNLDGYQKTLNLDDQKSLNLNGKSAIKPSVLTPASLARANTSKGASTEETYNEQILTAFKENTEALERNTEKSFGENQTSSIIEQIVPSSAVAEKQEKSDSLWDKFKSIFRLDDEPKSHAVGNDYVPYDNYLASLHKGEMVLTKMEADKYRQGATNAPQSTTANGTMSLNINISGAVDGMTPTNQERIVQAIVAKISSMSGLQGMLSNGFTRIQNV